ncbi:translation initiation factor IF-2 [Verrucomicrobiaceae bacterium 5K15]|uniref:Translation initiation factor IF-2 n=1 Tax=Oceaniferula flava TaxID=2800421 RepID=A0AAE2SGH1_9BACT|nr:translation initiation factor IF-2 [Oceaniferula flavus]MBK1856442.1 translation initiation factor IF-2 [Oceaniferula flavus]MBM1137749.1 translation initiation factor IF-2 [Oceaniferula flavus]
MADSSDKPKKSKDVLNLIDDNPGKKISRRERQRIEEASKVKSVDDQKKEALDIFEDEGTKKKTSVIKKKGGLHKQMPTISKILDPVDEFAASKSAAGAESSGADAGSDDQEKVAEVKEGKVITIKPPIVVSDLADLMELKSFQLMADLIKLEVFVAPHQAIEPEIAEKLCEMHGFVFEREKREKGGGVHKEKKKVKEPKAVEHEPEEKLEYRAPIITFMGHVDHGKTSLLDYVRKSRVTKGEAGGITQHIGAYHVDHHGHPISFIDTPGHSIFTEMRARGADVTDIVVLVIAADDGIMPQTKEAIEHAKKSEKTIIVAINKCDMPGADPMRVKTQLMEHGLQPVDFGGETECVEVSAVTGQGMEDLLELMALQAEVLELKANPRANARAAVIEASVQPGKGPTATVIVRAGTLKTGMPFICGPYAGKVKSMFNDLGEPVKEAGPAIPVEVIGFAELPHVGDELVQMKTEKASKKLSEERLQAKRNDRLQRPKMSRMEDLMSMVQGDNKAQLNIILKGDVQGSVQAIENAVNDIKSDKVEPRFISSAAGAITESDILMASSSGAVVLGFNTKVEAKAVKAAKSEGVQIKLFSVVYELLDTVEEAMLGLLDPITRETIIGHADVKQVFKVRKGRAAGCIIKDGKVSRTAHARVLRGKVPVFDGKMSTLRRHMDEVDEVKTGIECGIRLGSFDEYEEGDVIECYILEKIPQTL